MLDLKSVKANARDKMCQGDINIYKLGIGDELEVEGKPHKDPVLVTGNGGNHHRLVGKGFKVTAFDTHFKVEVTSKGVSLSHEQHKPPIKLSPGIYLIDRALEKGVFDDMVAPVVD